ncbi:MAG: hypothetical protein ACKVOO_03000 [Burkholderiaceae bacterium]
MLFREAAGLRSQIEVRADCFFGGTIGGFKNGHPYGLFSTPRIEILGGSPACVCPAAQSEYDGNYGVCHAASPQALSISGDAEIWPSGTGGTSTVQITAKVVTGNQPKLGVVVSFTVGVTANSGGHDHNDATRPRGSLSIAQGTTDVNGEVKVTFTASQIAGTHTISATCGNCINSPASKAIRVKVPDLVDIFTLPYQDAQWAIPGVGQRAEHTDNHYLTVAAATRLLDISRRFRQIWPTAPRLTLNDASLVWGGKFDIDGTWETNPRRHAEHRLGDNIDVRANTAPGAVPANIRAAVFRWLRRTSLPADNIPPEFIIDSVNALWEGPGLVNEHFHLRLGN